MAGSLIQNLVARLTMDTTAFDRNSRGASQSMRGMMADSLATQRGFAALATAGAKIGIIAGVAYGVARAVKSMTSASAEAERSERALATALEVNGDTRRGIVNLLEEHAERMQDLTVYSRDEVLQQMALARTMGAGSDELRGMTEAAIGLSAAYGRDLHSAMRLIALARQGETGQLKEMGIVLDRTKGKHQQYLQLLGIGHSNFKRAIDDAQTLSGSMEQLGNEWKQTKDSLVRPFTPVLTGILRTVRDTADAFNDAKKAGSDYLDTFKQNANPLMMPGVASQLQRGPGLRFNFGERLPSLQVSPEGEVSQNIQHRAPAPPTPVPESISKLNKDLKEQIAIQKEVASGNLTAAETVRFMLAAEEAYGKGTKESEAAVIKYRSALAQLNELRSGPAVDKMIESMAQENRILALTNAGRYDEARTLTIINDLEKDGITLRTEQRGRIEDLVRETRLLSDEMKIEQTLQGLQEENDTLSLISQGREDEARVLEIINDLKRQGIELTDEEKKRVKDLVAANEKLRNGYGNDIGGGIKGALTQMEKEVGGLGDLSFDVTREGIDGVARSISGAITKTRDWKESLRETGLAIADMLAQWAVKKMILGTLDMIFPGSGTAAGVASAAVPSARGNIFDTGGLVPFARGGVVDRPTIFPFARGTGLMGEAGPEAIMPLKRDSAGRLGVQSSGGNGDAQVWGRMVALLEKIAAKDTNVTVPVGFDGEAMMEKWSRTRSGQRAILSVVNGAE